MKTGRKKMQGVRWHPSIDPVQVRTLVERKVRQTIGMANVDQIDVVPTARNNGTGVETRNL